MVKLTADELDELRQLIGNFRDVHGEAWEQRLREEGVTRSRAEIRNARHRRCAANDFLIRLRKHSRRILAELAPAPRTDSVLRSLHTHVGAAEFV